LRTLVKESTTSKIMSLIGYTIFGVSQQRVQAIEIAVVACAFAVAIIVLSRRNRISFRYTMGWLTLSVLSAVGGLLLPVIEPLSRKFQLGAFSLVGALAVIVLLSLCIQLSISISGLQRQLRKLNEDIALQKKEIDDFRDSKQ
jgi:hypothetical protein